MILLHLDTAAHGPSTVGNPLYHVLPDHVPGLVAVAVLPVAVWLIGWLARQGGLAAAVVAGYRPLPAHERFVAWMLLVSAAVHLGLALGAEPPMLGALFVLDAALLLGVLRRLLLGHRWRLAAALVLTGSVLAYVVAIVAAEPPDQAGLATKLVELAALAVALRPRRATRPRRLAASAATVSLVVVTGLAAWAGAFATAERGGHDGHHGPAPAPGTLAAPIGDRAPTRAERLAARRFHRRAQRGLARYRDPAVAAADGYQVEEMAGSDFHAANPGYAADGRIFDPVRPEILVYARTSRGPVLLGAVYEMPSLDRRGPRIGGPLTHWHAHENVCITLLPPALSGLTSPFGGCPVGSITIPAVPEMIHLWVVPGAPTMFGDLDERWRAGYLASLES
jgi:hypothetical protein